jgi:hypothetical protein
MQKGCMMAAKKGCCMHHKQLLAVAPASSSEKTPAQLLGSKTVSSIKHSNCRQARHVLTDAFSSPFFSIFSLLFRWLPSMMV